MTLKIYHNGQLSRVMTQYFRNTGDDGVSHTTRWFLQGGEADSGIQPLYTRNNKNHSRTEIAAGVRHELHPGITRRRLLNTMIKIISWKTILAGVFLFSVDTLNLMAAC